MKKKEYMRVMGPMDRRKSDVWAVDFGIVLHVLETWLS